MAENTVRAERPHSKRASPKNSLSVSGSCYLQIFMVVASRSNAFPLLIVWGTSISLLGCNTGAVAIQECRDIEYVRCEAAPACGVGEVKTEEDVAACRRFYKEQCLHGIAGPKPPPAQAHKACLAAINAAAVCARQDKTTAPAACADLPLEQVEETKVYQDVCDVVGRPWDLAVCDYLQSVPDEGTAGSQG